MSGTAKSVAIRWLRGTPSTAEDRARAFRRDYDRVEKPDGAFVIVEKATGDVVGGGWADNRPGRKELPL